MLLARLVTGRYSNVAEEGMTRATAPVTGQSWFARLIAVILLRKKAAP